MATIIFDIQWDQQDDALKIIWRIDRYTRGHYFVDFGTVRERAGDVRRALQELVDAYCAGAKEQYGQRLRQVAEEGHGLYGSLFVGRQRQDNDVAARLRSWLLEPDRANDVIVFQVPGRIHIPWGLIYDGPVDENPPAPVEPSRFWCIKHKLVTQYDYMAAEGVEDEWQPSQFTLLLGAHEKVWTEAYPHLLDDARKVLNRLAVPPAQPRFAYRELLAQWSERSATAPFGLLSLYCHANGNMLCIGNDTISDRKFREQFKRDDIDKQPPTLVFLAGCETAIGDLGTGFLGATSGPGFCGLIGTEVKTPDVFTLGFLTSFLARFYEGGGYLGDIMKELREQHWPLSLVFSMCCAGDLRLGGTPKPAAQGEPSAPANLSEQCIVSKVSKK